MFTATNVILGLKIAVSAVTVLLLISIWAIATGRQKLHGKINLVYLILTLAAVIGFEVIIRFINPNLTAEFTAEQRQLLDIHLCFSIPSAILLPIMFYTGKHLPNLHRFLTILFSLLWAGTFVTGVFFLPHSFGG